MRRPWLTALIVIAGLIFLYVVASGLGLTRNFKKHRAEAKNQMILDFEHLKYDYDWTTGGYVQMEPSTENKTHGKYSAKATFLLYEQFYATATPSTSVSVAEVPTPVPTVAAPKATKKPAAPAASVTPMAVVAAPATPSSVSTPPIPWKPRLILDNRSPTQMGVYEWQEYASLKLDVFNPSDQPVSYYVQVADSRGYIYENSGSLTPKKVTNLSFPLDDTAFSRLDLSNIRSFQFGLDMTGATQPRVVYLDNFRLEGDAKAPKPQVVSSPTPRR